MNKLTIALVYYLQFSRTAWFLFHGMLDSHGVLSAAAPCVNQTALLTVCIEQMETEQNTLCTAILPFISSENTSHSLLSALTHRVSSRQPLANIHG